MSPSLLIGTVLVSVALLDLVVGFLFILPRVGESARPVLRLAVLAGAAVTLLLGAAFLAGVLPVGA